MPRFDRNQLMDKFRVVRDRQPIVGGGAGTGLSAKCEEAGGIDLIVIYNSGRYRMAGRGSLAGLLAYGNANEIVVDMGREVLPVVKRTPVLAGVNGTDPFCDFDVFLDDLKRQGFAGVQNFPHRGPDRRHLPRQPGRNRHGLRAGSGHDPPGAREGHADHALCVQRGRRRGHDPRRRRHHRGAYGLTTGGSIGAETALTLDDCVAAIDRIAAAALAVRDDVIVLCHGGPIATPEDAAHVLRACKHCHGFYGASSMERLPTEQALTAATREFKGLTF